MRQKVLVVSAAFLFLCVSMYLGTGWSLLLFSFPSAKALTPANYQPYLIPPVEAATHFFTYMTGAMLAAALVVIYLEWKTRYRWWPILTVLAVIAATLLTTQGIFPLNHELEAGIADAARLRAVLDPWMSLNRWRVALWTVQWLAMMAYFGLKAYRTEPQP
ncbi:MAG TPA: hypothetical protein VGG20_13995 [Thermoanaerobaculia bacterium]|jgi:hypothetical protein